MTAFDPRVHTLVGTPPVDRSPAMPRLHRSPLPDLDALQYDPRCLEDELLDLASNALQHDEDRDTLANSDPHMIAMLRLLQDLALSRDAYQDRITQLERTVASLQGQGEAYQRAIQRERDAAMDHHQFALLMQARNAALSSQLAQSERSRLRFLDLLSESLAAAPVIPPADEDAFADPPPERTTVFARGTDPFNPIASDTIVVDPETSR